MPQSEKKPKTQKRMNEFATNNSEILIFFIVLMGTIIIFFLFFYLYNEGIFSQFLTGITSGILGILLGFSLDRIIERVKDNKIKRDFLNLIYKELNEIKGLISPQVTEVNLLYTDIWDSVVSSGVIRLLDFEQVTKLSNLYKSIKGTSYEAEWVRRDFEEFQSTPINADERKVIEKKCIKIRNRHFERMQLISKQIDDVLEAKWWES